jgi:hypothetical protein
LTGPAAALRVHQQGRYGGEDGIKMGKRTNGEDMSKDAAKAKARATAHLRDTGAMICAASRQGEMPDNSSSSRNSAERLSICAAGKE